ncbi:MAG: sulfatase [Verrucomicrobia bacterium]|nr:sulfatase [Verrucomicrobiota bacterium]
MTFRFLLPLSLILGAPAAPAAGPNIVLAFADDYGAYASCYREPGHPSISDAVSTPAIDRIAREGSRCWNAFVSASSCSPSRAAVVSGRHFFRNGSHSQLHTPWDGDRSNDPWKPVRGFPLCLQDAGYRIGWSHKMHIDEDRMGGPQRNYKKAGGRINNFSEVMMAAPAAERPALKAAILDEVRRNLRDFLDDRREGQPFFYWFNPTNTHRTWVRGSGKELWGIDPDSLKGKLPPFLPDNPAVREDVADFLGEVQAFDAAVGVLTEELERRGEMDRTLFVVSGDNGIPGFPRGKTSVYDFGSRVPLVLRWPGGVKAGGSVKAPVSLVDLAPTFLAAANLPADADMNGQNLLPVLKGDAPESTLRGHAVIGREVHFHAARAGNLPYPVRALRTGGFLFVHNFKPDRNPLGDPLAAADPAGPKPGPLANNTGSCFPDLDASPTKTWLVGHRADPAIAEIWDIGFMPRPEFELFDLAKDPHQMKNVADDPAYATTRADLAARLDRILRENADPRLANDAFDSPPYLTRAAQREKPSVKKADH